jgi:hypothetical protein
LAGKEGIENEGKCWGNNQVNKEGEHGKEDWGEHGIENNSDGNDMWFYQLNFHNAIVKYRYR